MGAVSRNHGLERDWSGKEEKGSEASPLQTAGLVPGIFLLSQPSPRNSIAIAIAAFLRPCLCRTSKHSTAYLPTHPSLHPLNALGLRDSKEDPVCESRKVTYYVPTLESGHSDQSATVCLVFAFLQDKKEKQANKQWSVVSG